MSRFTVAVVAVWLLASITTTYAQDASVDDPGRLGLTTSAGALTPPQVEQLNLWIGGRIEAMRDAAADMPAQPSANEEDAQAARDALQSVARTYGQLREFSEGTDQYVSGYASALSAAVNQALREDVPPVVQRYLIQAVARLVRPECLATLRGAVLRNDPTVRYWAVRGIGQLRDTWLGGDGPDRTQIIELLVSRGTSEQNPVVLRAIYEVLGGDNGQALPAALLQVLEARAARYLTGDTSGSQSDTYAVRVISGLYSQAEQGWQIRTLRALAAMMRGAQWKLCESAVVPADGSEGNSGSPGKGTDGIHPELRMSLHILLVQLERTLSVATANGSRRVADAIVSEDCDQIEQAVTAWVGRPAVGQADQRPGVLTGEPYNIEPPAMNAPGMDDAATTTEQDTASVGDTDEQASEQPAGE